MPYLIHIYQIYQVLNGWKLKNCFQICFRIINSKLTRKDFKYRLKLEKDFTGLIVQGNF